MSPWVTMVAMMLGQAIAGPPLPPQPLPQPEVQVPREAVDMAWHDLTKNVPQADWPHVRYVWFPDKQRPHQGAIVYAVNTAISHAHVGITPHRVNGYLLRLDMRKLLPEIKDRLRVLNLLEGLFDPYLYVLDHPRKRKRFVEPYQAKDGKFYDFVWDEGPKFKFGLHASPGHGAFLQDVMGTNTPIFRHDFLLTKILTTVQGGLYYRLLGLEKSDAQQTAQEKFFALFGVTEKQIQSLKADERAGIFHSGVTAKPRRNDVFFILGVRPSSGVAIGSITHDTQDGDVDPARHPMYNLLNFIDRAREAIFTRPNGFLIYVLFNGAGELQDEAPPNVAADHEIPRPYTKILQPAISCIRCHGPFDQWQPIKNDVQRLTNLKNAKRINILDDFSDEQGGDRDSTLDRLSALYSGDVNPTLDMARDGHNKACLLVTKMTVQQVATALSEVYADYNFTPITPQVAVRELGHAVDDEEEAALLFDTLVPKLPANDQGFSPEDPSIGMLRAWTKEEPTSINRLEWEKVYADVAIRAETARIERLQEN